MIILITGTIASGKGKVAELIKEKGFEHHSFSSIIRVVARERGIKSSRATLSKLGRDLREESKESVLASRVMVHVKDFSKNYVIDGLRDLSELFYVKKFGKENKIKVYLMGVDAPQKVRFDRSKHRGRHGDPVTFEEFKKIDDLESHGNVGKEVGECLHHADFIIENVGSLDELKDDINHVLDELKE